MSNNHVFVAIGYRKSARYLKQYSILDKAHSLWLTIIDAEAYRALYTDGQASIRMKRSRAKNYARIFGGRIIFDPKT